MVHEVKVFEREPVHVVIGLQCVKHHVAVLAVKPVIRSDANRAPGPTSVVRVRTHVRARHARVQHDVAAVALEISHQRVHHVQPRRHTYVVDPRRVRQLTVVDEHVQRRVQDPVAVGAEERHVLFVVLVRDVVVARGGQVVREAFHPDPDVAHVALEQRHAIVRQQRGHLARVVLAVRGGRLAVGRPQRVARATEPDGTVRLAAFHRRRPTDGRVPGALEKRSPRSLSWSERVDWVRGKHLQQLRHPGL